MVHRHSGIILLLLTGLSLNTTPVTAGSSKEALLSEGHLAQSLRGNGMQFVQNKGQIADSKQNLRPDVLFKGSGAGADVYIRKTGFSFVLSNLSEVLHEMEEEIPEAVRADDALRIRFVDGDIFQ